MMKYLLAVSFLVIGCSEAYPVDTTAPAPPRGVQTLAVDNAVQVTWMGNTERDIGGYNVWVSERYDGRYSFLGSTGDIIYVDYSARNGTTYYYAVSAYDYERNESDLSRDVAAATPRPEGFGVQLSDYRTVPSSGGYDFSTYSNGRFDDDYTDVFFEHFNGRFYLNVWSDTDIQGMGYTTSLDDITKAPTSGWTPSRSVEAIPGHTYIVWTWDNHYAKMRVRSVNVTSVVFDWAYQTAKGVTALKRPGSERRLKPRSLSSQTN